MVRPCAAAGRGPEADPYERFRDYTEVASAGQPVYVQAKIVMVDDRLRVGSSNLNSRSMGYDAE